MNTYNHSYLSTETSTQWLFATLNTICEDRINNPGYKYDLLLLFAMGGEL